MSGRRAIVELRRAGVVESLHYISAALIDPQGQLLAWTGEPTLVTYLRSAAKPFQAVPLVADGAADAFDFSESELAICCSSHSGEAEHVETVLGVLSRIGCAEADLECGAHEPLHAPSAAALRNRGQMATPVHNNCSGKHAGMLAWSRHEEVDTKGYLSADHPVQERIRREITYWTETPSESLSTGIDGCGVVTFALPLHAMAGAFAKFVAAAEDEPGSPASRITRAMTRAPYFVAGTGRLVTQIMEATGGRILAKDGAEGVICLADRERRWGLALKAEDGARRAVGPAVVEFLAQADMLGEGELGALDEYRTGSVTNRRGEFVGEVRSNFLIERSV